MTTSTVGDVMQEGRNRALKTLAIGAGIVVYIGMIGYSAVHNFRLMTAGVAEDMLIWAVLGVLSLEVTALALPIALHWWCHAPLQRFAALAFYGIDLALVFINVVLDFAVVSQAETLPGWMQIYAFYAVPATPIICGLGWSLLFLLDPSQRERATRETLAASTKEVLANRIAKAAQGAEVESMVQDAARAAAWQIVTETLGVTRSLPMVIPSQAREVEPEPEPAKQNQARKKTTVNEIPADRLAQVLELIRSNGDARVYASDTQDSTRPNGQEGGEL